MAADEGGGMTWYNREEWTRLIEQDPRNKGFLLTRIYWHVLINAFDANQYLKEWIQEVGRKKKMKESEYHISREIKKIVGETEKVK